MKVLIWNKMYTIELKSDKHKINNLNFWHRKKILGPIFSKILTYIYIIPQTSKCLLKNKQMKREKHTRKRSFTFEQQRKQNLRFEHDIPKTIISTNNTWHPLFLTTRLTKTYKPKTFSISRQEMSTFSCQCLLNQKPITRNNKIQSLLY